MSYQIKKFVCVIKCILCKVLFCNKLTNDMLVQKIFTVNIQTHANNLSVNIHVRPVNITIYKLCASVRFTNIMINNYDNEAVPSSIPKLLYKQGRFVLQFLNNYVCFSLSKFYNGGEIIYSLIIMIKMYFSLMFRFV